MLIVFAIKGPSWYKLYHNYRHQRLAQDRDEEKDVVSAGISGRYLRNQTYTFKQHNGQIHEEEWDEYFEDPYIKKEEVHAGEENLPEPWRKTQQVLRHVGKSCFALCNKYEYTNQSKPKINIFLFPRTYLFSKSQGKYNFVLFVIHTIFTDYIVVSAVNV